MQQIFFVIAAIRILLLLQIFKVLMKQWIMSYVTDQTLNQHHLKMLYLTQIVFTIGIISWSILAIDGVFGTNLMNTGALVAALYCICVILASIVFIYIFKHMKHALENIRITQKNMAE